ncbi:hypothetical protein EniLVp02_0241 [Vibrio phage EniLVp02]
MLIGSYFTANLFMMVILLVNTPTRAAIMKRPAHNIAICVFLLTPALFYIICNRNKKPLKKM